MKTTATCLLSLMLMLSALQGVAQTVLNGRVTDQTGAPVPGANVYLESTYDGATTDVEGKFSFSTMESGAFTLVIRFVGYREYRQVVTLQGSAMTVAVTLVEMINQLEAVAITAGSFTAGDAARQTIFGPLDIATTAGAAADIATALNTLPGTQTVGESGRLFVRGGDGTETRTFIDGLAVFHPYGATAPNTPSRGRFSPFMFKGMSFSTGGYSAEFGQALSSALVLDSRDRADLTRTDVSIMSVGADVSHTHQWEKSSLATKVEYTNIKPYYHFIPQELDWITAPEALAGSAAYRHTVGKAGMVKAYGTVDRSQFSLYQQDLNTGIRSPYDLTNTYYYVNTSYRNTLGKQWILRGGAAYTQQQNDTDGETEGVKASDKDLHLKAVLEGSLSDRFEVLAGVEVLDRNLHQQLYTTAEGASYTGFEETIGATFVEGSLFFSEKLLARAGIRAACNGLSRQAIVDPRASLAWRTGQAGSVCLAYGRFHQSPADAYLYKRRTLGQEQASHYIVSYQRTHHHRTLRAETYYKTYTHLVKYPAGNDTHPTNQGDGYARGLDLFWRDNRSIRNSDYWLSYSYLDTERNYLDYPHAATPSFASAHNASAVYKYFVTKLKTQLGTTLSWASHRVYDDPNTAAFNDGKTPAYFSWSVNLAYLPTPNIVVYAAASNLTGRDNVFGYTYADTPNAQGRYAGRPIGQPARRFLFIGLFITFAKDKSMNMLPAL